MMNMSFPGETRTIKLYTPIILDGGVELTEITFREPVVRDRIAFAKDRGS
ncbi:TPA: phage tail assembly protein, partial [Providencia alcalifaciens]